MRARIDGTERLLVLGAWEALWPRLENRAAVAAEQAWTEALASGLRLLLFAEACDPAAALGATLPDLKPLALVALSDEPRPGAGDVLISLAAQGLRIKILSGDHPATIRATMEALRLPVLDLRVISGDELARSANPLELIQTRDIFGRVSPAQKLEVISMLQSQGERVAMVGDGVNDIHSIKRADLGIAMGEGSSAVRDVAGLVLENNDFAILPAALSEGRIVVQKVRHVSKLFLLKNIYALVLIVTVVGVFGMDFPMLPQQVTLLNSLTIGIPVFVLITLGIQAAPAPIEKRFLREVGRFVLTTGTLVGFAGLGVMLLATLQHHWDVGTQRTMLLAALVLLGVGNLLRVVGWTKGPWGMRDWLLYGWACAGSADLHGGDVLAPGRPVFRADTAGTRSVGLRAGGGGPGLPWLQRVGPVALR